MLLDFQLIVIKKFSNPQHMLFNHQTINIILKEVIMRLIILRHQQTQLTNMRDKDSIIKEDQRQKNQ